MWFDETFLDPGFRRGNRLKTPLDPGFRRGNRLKTPLDPGFRQGNRIRMSIPGIVILVKRDES